MTCTNSPHNNFIFDFRVSCYSHEHLLSKCESAYNYYRNLQMATLFWAKTLHEKDWILLMFLSQSFMTSIYSIISIEARLVTHFSGYKTTALHKKAMLYVLNHDFRFFAYWNIIKFCKSIHFALVTLIY